MGVFLNFTEAQLAKVAIMDSAAVSREFRGNGLQGKMLEAAEKELDTEKYTYLMCTVHPMNRYSLSICRNTAMKSGELPGVTEACPVISF